MRRTSSSLGVVLLAGSMLLAGSVSWGDESAETHELRVQIYQVGDIVARKDRAGKTTHDVDALAEIIRFAVQPDSWQVFGGPGTISPVSSGSIKGLAIRQTAGVHEEVADLLKALRQAARDTAAGKAKVCYGPCCEPAAAFGALQEKLAKKITLRFSKRPLADVTRSLGKSTGVKLDLDIEALEDVGIKSNVPGTISVRDISLRAALRWMLRDLDLTYMRQDDVLVITTPEVAAECLSLGVYPVADLIGRNHGAKPAGLGLSELEKRIQTIVRPESWDVIGGSGGIKHVDFDNLQALVVDQAMDVHEETAALLTAIRKLRAVAADDERSQTILTCGLTPAEADAEEAINKALAAKTSMTFQNILLADAAAELGELAKINVRVDRRALEDVGLSDDTTVSLRHKDIPLRSALDRILKRHDLTWIIRDEVLVITTVEEEWSCLATKLYLVGDLVTCRDESGKLWDDYATLIDVLQNIDPDSWEIRGGPGSMTGLSVGKAKILVVRQTQTRHRSVAQWLGRLRAVVRDSDPERKPPLRKRPPPTKKQPRRKPVPPVLPGFMF